MVDRSSDTAIDVRLQDFLSAELRRAEADYPDLAVRTHTSGRVAAPLGLAVMAAVLVATVVLMLAVEEAQQHAEAQARLAELRTKLGLPAPGSATPAI
jgi:hypothetical protein